MAGTAGVVRQHGVPAAAGRRRRKIPHAGFLCGTDRGRRRAVHAGQRGRAILAAPGGGGYGNPADRDAGSIAEDVAEGYVSSACARELYGYDNG